MTKHNFPIWPLAFAGQRRKCNAAKSNFVFRYSHTRYQVQTSLHGGEGLKSFLIIYKEQAARLFLVFSLVLLWHLRYFPLLRRKYLTKLWLECWFIKWLAQWQPVSQGRQPQAKPTKGELGRKARVTSWVSISDTCPTDTPGSQPRSTVHWFHYVRWSTLSQPACLHLVYF